MLGCTPALCCPHQSVLHCTLHFVICSMSLLFPALELSSAAVAIALRFFKHHNNQQPGFSSANCLGTKHSSAAHTLAWIMLILQLTFVSSHCTYLIASLDSTSMTCLACSSCLHAIVKLLPIGCRSPDFCKHSSNDHESSHWSSCCLCAGCQSVGQLGHHDVSPVWRFLAEQGPSALVLHLDCQLVLLQLRLRSLSSKSFLVP